MRTETEKVVLPSIDSVPEEHWARLSEKKIFFGHKSIGYNMIDGIGDIMKEHDCVKLKIIETDDPEDFDEPIFAHAQVGKNTDPQSKISAFKNFMDSGGGDKVDIAFFKFCYVDVERDSDPEQIFEAYYSAIKRLKTKYPATKFMHVTVPIRSGPKTTKGALKESVKFFVGKSGFLDDNLKRQCYNGLLNSAYTDAGNIFDLAFVESVTPNGFRCYATKGSKKVYVMCPEYTDDGGHLNEMGRRIAAEQLLIILARVASGDE